MPRLTGIEVELGITAEIAGTYVKPTARVKLEFTQEEASDTEVIKQAWENAWDATSREVERVINEYASNAGSTKTAPGRLNNG